MNFNSFAYLLYLPIVVLVYFLLPAKYRWAWLLGASYYFYMSWNPTLIFLILSTTFVSYGSSLIIEKTEKKILKKCMLVLTLVVCLGVLFFFKYFSFLLQSVSDFLRMFSLQWNAPQWEILLPVGISFYTFQTLSYVIDVYRGSFRAEKHFGYYALFVVYFPQLVAGPIERPERLIPQLKEEHFLNREDFKVGITFLISGFMRKCLIADLIGKYVNSVYADLAGANSLAVFVASLLFFVQMYCDFAGYSEIALGSARIMGVKLIKNFDRPLISGSFTEFFRRWHISLNQWFTDYLYIPLGGNRKGTLIKLRNIFIVFTLCGLWHGARWTYVLWGVYAAVMIALETLWKQRQKKRKTLSKPLYRHLSHIKFWALCIPSLVLFRSMSLADASQAFVSLFTHWTGLSQTLSQLSMGGIDLVIVVLAIALVCVLPSFCRRSEEKGNDCLPLRVKQERRIFECLTYSFAVVTVMLAWLLVISQGDLSAFAYFQF